MTPQRPRGRPRLIGLPYDASSSFLPGAAEAPVLIRAALHSPGWNSWAHGLRDLLAADGLTDAGDLALPPTEAARALIESGVSDLASAGWRPIALGGDHSVTYPAVRGVVYTHGPVTILHSTLIPTCTRSSRATAGRTRAPSPGSWKRDWPDG